MPQGLCLVKGYDFDDVCALIKAFGSYWNRF